MTPQHPAAPETETDANGRLTADERDALAAGWPDFWQVHAAVERILDDRATAARERVRVVEGERDAALDRYAEREQRWHWALIKEQTATARAISAEAAREAEKAAHERLARFSVAVGRGECEWCDNLGTTPTPVPSEVAETTAGEREVEALFDCSCGHSIDEHNGLGCYARLSYTPLVTCECPLTDDRTHGELLAPRLAALLDRVRREEGARVLREAATATEQFAEEVYGEHFFRRPTKQDYAEINALLKRERGHQLDGVGADCYHHSLTVRAEMLREMAAEIEEAE